MSGRSRDYLELWKNRELDIDNFYRIFNVPFPNYPEIEYAAKQVKDALKSRDNFTHMVDKNKLLQEKYQSFESFSDDVLSYVGICIKLAGEGHIAESLMSLRASIDLFITSLFASLVWEPKYEQELNPLGQLNSPYYHLLEEIDVNDLVINAIGLGEEKEGVELREIVRKKANEFLYDYLKALNIEQKNIEDKALNKPREILRDALGSVFMKLFQAGSKEYTVALKEVTKPETFVSLLMDADKYSYKVCNEHLELLLEDLNKRLKIGGEITDEIRANLKPMTFRMILNNNPENNGEVPICGVCGKPAEIGSIPVRFNKRSMLQYMRFHLNENTRKKINTCVKKALKLEKTVFFGDFLYYGIYNQLNPYAHGDPKEEPGVNEWYDLYLKPFLQILICVYDNILGSTQA